MAGPSIAAPGGYIVESGSRWQDCRERLPGGRTVESGFPLAVLRWLHGPRSRIFSGWIAGIGSPEVGSRVSDPLWLDRGYRIPGGWIAGIGSPVVRSRVSDPQRLDRGAVSPLVDGPRV